MPQTRHAFVYLASQSPRRGLLLDQLGVSHQPLLPNADGDAGEDAEGLEDGRSGELPQAYVERVTAAKLLAARARLQRRGLAPAPVLCADTIVALGRRILGKPQDSADAAAMLASLSGRSHRVLTAVAVHDGSRTWRALNVSQVRFAALPPRVIQAYVDGREPFGKAGAYAIQGALAGWIQHIAGSHSGIMGLPLHETRLLLESARVQMPL